MSTNLEALAQKAMSSDDLGADSAFVRLCSEGVPAFDLAKSYLASPDLKQQLLATDIIGQLDADDLQEERISVLETHLNCDGKPELLGALCRNCQYFRSDQLCRRLLELSSHVDRFVRLGVAQGLSGQCCSLAVEKLTDMMFDEDEEVAIQATHAVAVRFMSNKHPQVMRALWKKAELDDDSEEAILGLALRGDVEVVPLLHERLGQLDPFQGVRLVEAAAAIRDPSSRQPLVKLRNNLLRYVELLDSAIGTNSTE